MKQILLGIVTIVLFCACAPKKDITPPPSEQATAPSAETKKPTMAELTPEQMKEKVKQFSTPGEAHATLQPLVGKWETEVKFWKDPNQKPEITKGTANRQWVLGKRFIKEEYKGTFQGEAFQGVGTIGYDNVKKSYVSTWIDSMSTGIMRSEGQYDPAAKAIEMSGKFSCPLTDQEMEDRTVTKILDKNRHTFEVYNHTPDGKEVKMMEIMYKRKS